MLFYKTLSNIKVINKSGHALPAYETAYSAGLDLRANLENTITIKPGERSLIGTGLYFEIPAGLEAQIRPRSGLALKFGITVLNSPGTIDADYRGEIKVLLINHSDQNFQVNNGDRIAQVIFAEFKQIGWHAVEELTDTVRGAGGYGHTGQK